MPTPGKLGLRYLWTVFMLRWGAPSCVKDDMGGLHRLFVNKFDVILLGGVMVREAGKLSGVHWELWGTLQDGRAWGPLGVLASGTELTTVLGHSAMPEPSRSRVPHIWWLSSIALPQGLLVAVLGVVTVSLGRWVGLKGRLLGPCALLK
jgi:hypothetical protein